MYIAITKQQTGVNYKGSVRDFARYLEKENEGKDPEFQEHFFNQYHDHVATEEVITGIDNNTAKLGKDDPKFYSLVVSPSSRELRHIGNDPDKLRSYTRELMKDYAASFYRNKKVTVHDILYYAKLEHVRYFKGTDWQIKENQMYATKILELKHELRKIERGDSKGNTEKLTQRIAELEKEAPHKLHGKRIVQGMKKEGFQSHIHIIVSRTDITNTHSLSPGTQHKENTTILNGKEVKQGFNREKFFKAVEKTFDRTFGYKRNFVESYKARNLFLKDPKRFFMMLTGLPVTERQMAFKLLHKSGMHIPNIPTNKVQLAFKAFMKLKKGVERAASSGSIGI